MDSFAKKNVVITGAAQGIGKELAVLLAREGANLAIIDINEKLLTQTREELSGYGTDVRSYVCNLANIDEIINVTDTIKSEFSKIDILVNNAGIISGKYISDLSYEDIQLTIAVNLTAVMMMTKQFLDEMMARNDGHIVNVSSVAGLMGAPKMGDYCASKHGVNGFSDTLRMELKKKGLKGVKITVICPSLITTGMFAGFKTNIFTPPLTPTYVAEKIVESIKKNKLYVKMPLMMRQINMVKALPTHVSDFLFGITGVTKAMDTFKGRK